MTRTTFSRRAVVPIAALTLLLAACGDDTDPATSEVGPEAAPGGPELTAAPTEALTVADPWISTADSGMTGAYGVLTNGTGEDLTVVAATSDVSPRLELHETVMDDSGAMVMQPIEGGLVVPAGGSRTLEPGGDHVMVMDLGAEIAAGEEVEITLELEDGSTVPMTASARDHAGGDENYVGGDGEGSTESPDDGGMDMDDMDDMDMGGETSAPSDG